MSAHNEALNVEVHRGKRALEHMKVKFGCLETNINELMEDVGVAGEGTGGADAAI